MLDPVCAPLGVNDLYSIGKELFTSAGAGIDHPEAIIRMLVLEAIRQFARSFKKPPRVLYIPKAVEAALQVDRARNYADLKFPPPDNKIRALDKVFGCTPVWDAKDFRVE